MSTAFARIKKNLLFDLKQHLERYVSTSLFFSDLAVVDMI